MIAQHGSLIELNKSEIIELFDKGHFAHLACNYQNDLYLVPISYAYHEGIIYSHSKAGKKINMMRGNSKVCIQVEKVESFFRWQSALAWGTYEELAGEDAARAMRILIKSFSKKEPVDRVSDLEADFAAQLEGAIIYQIKISEFSGRAEGY